MRLIDADIMENQLGKFVTKNLGEIKAVDIKKFIQEQPTAYDVDKVVEEYNNRWIPVTWRYTTDEDGIDKEIYPKFLDCKMPDGDANILICTKNGYVHSDIAFDDDGYYLDSGCDWIDDVIAWQPLPEPYKAGETNE